LLLPDQSEQPYGPEEQKKAQKPSKKKSKKEPAEDDLPF